ncbi:PDZK1-interacting protein 1 [Austrofundulus limnaeus]|uniref:PDZK1-interacting protein 1 n=1 Tax=Austrofundulus limnaeus TaxID=52670 RepID=A0A2I4CUG7_AUSLI|nr:PREDICTED: proximal tubules-expressed gene protein-like [Austrofundulus limnaeus]
MENRSVLILCLLLLIGAVMGQSAPPRSSERLMPQWLTGIIAVSSFLLIVFIGFVVKKMWCEKSSGMKQNQESMRSNVHEDGNVYDTNMDSLRRPNNRNPRKEHTNESCDDIYDTNLDDLRMKSNKSKKENIYETCDTHNETSLEGIRPNYRKTRKENIYESCDDNYETSLDVLRNQSRKNVYDNKAMDHTENKSTSM